MNGTVFITGASRGIGRAAALRFASAGYKVGINYNQSKDEAMSLVKEISEIYGVCHAVKADVSSLSEAKAAVSEIQAKLGRISVLINNAGIAYNGMLQDTTPEIWERLFAVNVNGVYNCTSLILPEMISACQGRIISISSIWGVAGASCEVAYSATKAAVIGFTKALSKEVARSGVTVNCIAPGVIDTDMNKGLNAQTLSSLINEIPAGRLGSADDVASLILYLASPEASYITGQVISPNGGFVV